MTPRAVGRGAFTLVELLVSTALIGILTTNAVGSVLAIQRTAQESGFRAEADQEIKMLADWLAAAIRGAGGDALSPWMAVYAENDIDTTSVDRLTWADLDEAVPPCTLAGHDGEFAYDLASGTDPNTCCLDATVEGRQVMLVTAEGDAWRSLRIEEVEEGVASCSVSFVDSGRKPLGSQVPSSGLLAEIDELPVQRRMDTIFEGGTLLVVDVLRVSLDNETELMLEEDRDPLDGEFESRLMMDRVYDLQVALGYDCKPRDGLVSNDATVMDEWLGNALNDTFGRGGLVGARQDDLRMVTVGFTHGSPTEKRYSNPVRLMDGPILSLSGVVLRPHSTRIALRNRVAYQ